MKLAREEKLINKYSLKMIFYKSVHNRDIPGISTGKESTCNAGDPGLIPGSGRAAGEGIGHPSEYFWTSLVAQPVKNLLQWGRPGSIPGLGRSPGEGRSYPLKHSGLEKSMDSIVYGSTKSKTRLSDFHYTIGLRSSTNSAKNKSAFLWRVIIFSSILFHPF